VKEGDCSVIEHNSGHKTVIDVCNAKLLEPVEEALMASLAKSERGISGNFQQKKYPANTYLPARGITRVRRFFVTNYDEDHISDLLAVRQSLYIEALTRNSSMSSAQICSLKTPPISPAMNELLGMVDSFTGEVTPQQLEPAGLQVWFFHNDYPTFTDTNNLSLATCAEELMRNPT